MTHDDPGATRESVYEGPSTMVVGSVRDLTAGPVTKTSETSGGFYSNLRAMPPRTDETED